MRLVWSPFAVERLVEIGDSIARDRPNAAGKWIGGAFDAVSRLTRLPASGRAVPEVARRELREVIYGQYRIIYRVASDEMVVLTIRHARQELHPADSELL